MKTILCLSIVFSALLTTFGMSYAEPAMPDTIVRVGATATPGWPWSVACQGSYVYVGDRQALVIIDIGVPSNPFIVGTLSTFHIQPLAVFVADTVAHTIQIGPEFATASIADPTGPYELGWCGIPIWTQEPKALVVVDTCAFLPDADNGLQVVNVAQPNAPAVVGFLDTPGIARDLFVQATIAYVADGDSLQIVDVSDPTDPFRLGALAMPNPCYDAFVVDTFAYVVCESNTGSDGTMQVVNVSDPSNAFIVNNVTMNGDPWAIYVLDSYAYVVAGDYWGLHKGGVRQVGGLRLERELGIQADIEGGLRIVDISDPGNPTLVASYDTPGDPRDVFVDGDLVFIADYDSLQILQHVIVGVEEKSVVSGQQLAIRLGQNRPNPFTGSTVIFYSLPVAGSVALAVYDLAGRLVEIIVDEKQEPGVYRVQWRPEDKASGIYFYSLQAGDFMDIKKMILLR